MKIRCLRLDWEQKCAQNFKVFGICEIKYKIMIYVLWNSICINETQFYIGQRDKICQNSKILFL